VEIGQFVRFRPRNLFEIEIYRLAREAGHFEKEQPDRGTVSVAKVVAPHLLADLGFNLQFLTQFPGERIARGLPGFHLPPRKLPFQRVASSALSLANQDSSVSFDHTGYDVHLSDN